MTPHELLVKGRELISDEKRWARGKLARDASGSSVPAVYDTAVCFCSVGAMVRVSFGEEDPDLYYEALHALSRFCDFDTPDFNDTQTHAEVLAAWDRAIANTAP